MRLLILSSGAQAAAAVWDSHQRHPLEPSTVPKYKLPYLEQGEH